MTNQHDSVFKDLIANRDFAVSFLQQYMPQELVNLIDWKTVKLDTANVEHVRQQQKRNLKQKEQSDLTFLFKFKDNCSGAVFVHIESQTSNDETIVIRTRHYQTSYLLDYIKRNKTAKNLPLVVSIIYYANRKPFSYSLDINDYFENKDLAQKYAFRLQFIDLNRFSDSEILAHGFIAGYELILKAIRENSIDGKLNIAVHQIEAYDHIARQVLIRYMSQYSDMEAEEFYGKIMNSKPSLRGDVMTVAEKWEAQGIAKGVQQGMQQGIQQGMQQGIQQGARLKAEETACKMLHKGYAIDDVCEITGLDQKDVIELKERIKNTRH